VDFAHRQETQFEWVRRPSEWLVYPWIEWQRLGQNFKQSSGLGAFLAAFLPAGPIAAIWALLRRRRNDTADIGAAHRRAIALLLAGTGLVLGLWWLLGDRQPRYFMGALVFLFPLIAVAIAAAHAQARRLVELTGAVCVVFMLCVIGSHELLAIGSKTIGGGFRRDRFYEYPAAIDQLPADAVVVNLAQRPWNYPLLGAGLRNRVIDFMDAVALLSETPIPPLARVGLDPETAGGFVMRAEALAARHATHLFTVGRPRLEETPCARLRMIASLDRNPANGAAYDQPRTLYAIDYCPAVEANTNRRLDQ